MVRKVLRSRRQYVSQSEAMEIARQAGATGATMPDYVEPLLAQEATHPPGGDKWLYEIKWDGYRTQLHKSDTGTFCFTRRGHNWSARMPPIVEGAWHLKAHSVIIDGEAVVMTERGDSDFSALESYVSSKDQSRDRHNFVYVVFDLLYIDGLDLRRIPLVDRKRALEALLKESPECGFKYSEHLEGDGAKILRNACQLQLEGVVSKRKDGFYSSGRNGTWTKTLCRQRDTFLIAGLAFEGSKFDGVYLGREKDGEIVFAGKVERGFSEEQVKRLKERSKKLIVKKQPFAVPIKKPKGQWLKPVLLGEVEYRRTTTGGLLRHPSFKGLREDLGVSDVIHTR